MKIILLGKGAGVVAAVSTSPGAIGRWGVGETCEPREIDCDNEVKRCFSDGGYWLSLGRDATDAQVIKQVAEVVWYSGGILPSNEIRSRTDVNRATRKACVWFSGHWCLFLCDELWST